MLSDFFFSFFEHGNQFETIFFLAVWVQQIWIGLRANPTQAFAPMLGGVFAGFQQGRCLAGGALIRIDEPRPFPDQLTTFKANT
jgi:hypothetical protein